MHIVDGALSNPVLIGGAVLAVGGIAMGLKKLPLERIPAAGPSSVHLILNGLAGLVLGWAAFPALFVGLLLQAVFFGFGGLTVLGVNAVNIAGPAVLAGLIFGRLVSRGGPMQGAIWGGLGGGFAIAATTLAVAFSLALSGDEFVPAAKLVFVAHIPVIVIEALLSGAAIFLARRVKPELFAGSKGGWT